MNFAQRAATAGALAALAVAPAAAQEGAADIGTLLLSDPAVKAAMDVVKRDEPQLLLDQVRLCEIPAPSNEETLRGAAVKKLFEDAGLKDVRVDAVGNVIATRAGRAPGPRLVMAAHLDTVFPAETELKFPREGDKFTGPGIGDNCRGLAALLGVIRTLQKTNLQTEGPVTFVANVGEEAKGNLRGVTYLFNDGMKGQIDRFISIDGSGEGFTHVGVGAFRYRVTFRGPGGHSYFSFGMANPMFALGRAIAKVAQFQAPADPRTTFSVGLVGGGTSVNSIAGEAWFEVDMRSHDRAALDAINVQFQKAVAAAVAEENARWDGNKPVAVEMAVYCWRRFDGWSCSAGPDRAHVEEGCAVEVRELGQLPDRVLRDRGVEARGIGLLVAELAQQPDGSPRVMVATADRGDVADTSRRLPGGITTYPCP